MTTYWSTDIDARIEELKETLAYDGNKAVVGPSEMISALQEIKRLRAKVDNPWFEVGDVLGHIESDGDREYIHPYCGGHFGRDDYYLKTVVAVEPTQLTVVYPNGKQAIVTIGDGYACPTFSTRDDALRYRVPSARAAELNV